jgi:hypothetical protein
MRLVIRYGTGERRDGEGKEERARDKEKQRAYRISTRDKAIGSGRDNPLLVGIVDVEGFEAEHGIAGCLGDERDC